MRSKRARRLAGCTALAVSAGMLLASPASADSPAPHAVAEKPAQAPTAPSLRAVPQTDGARAGAAGVTAERPPSRSDLDGDGQSDLIIRLGGQLRTATTNSEGAEFYRNDGDTSFIKDVIPLGDQDLNGSGPEILTISKFGWLSLYGDSTPSYGNYRWSGPGWQIYNKVFSPGDISGDGRADVLARTPSGELWVYVSTGTWNAPFHARKLVGKGWQYYDQLIGLGDSDGDGNGDFLARTPSGVLFYYGSTGSPYTVKARKEVGRGWQQYNQIIGIDDDNANGVPDVLARGVDGTLYEYFGTGSGYYTSRKQVGSTGVWAGVDQFSGAGNVPAHGKEGMVARTKGGTLFWYNSLNNGRLAARDQISDDNGWYGATLFEVNSLGRDGVSDTLEIFDGRLYGNGVDFGGGWGAINQIAGPGDLNGDGTGDFVARDRDGVLWLYRSNYDGTALHARVKIGSGWNAYDRIVGSGDYSGDGRGDLIARAKDGTLYLYQGTGQASYAFKSRVKIGGGWNAYAKIVAPGDVTGDGKADLLAVNSGGELFRYSGTGDTGYVFKPRASIGTGYQIYNGLY
ncbi:FG-GAP-like repeat-containing protein [Streptomyces sp. NK15101]|uniref:FG-GAP-like repeat-containing protein n=1 Tax=Streptomyces sp. NK15101 TaxID=2873261 RepID=UPI001CECF1EB|nr:FG-GAP-like repeat-containing protein [Streptomyces sp. NK15101]